MEQMQQIENKESGSKIVAIVMQWLGILCAAIGALILLCEKAVEIDAVGRFHGFTAIISMCAGLGFYLSRQRHDHKNARTLIAIFFACLPIFWSQLGAVVYAGVVGVSTFVPEAFRISAVSSLGLGASLACAGLVILPLTYIAARILFPRCSIESATVLTGIGSLLCLPVRTGGFAELLLVFVSLSVLTLERDYFSRNEHLQTGESRLVRAAILSLPVIMVGRASCYGFSDAGMAVKLFSFGSVIFWIDTLISKGSTFRDYASDICVAIGLGVLTNYLKGSVDLSFYHFVLYALPAGYFLLTARARGESESLWIITAVAISMVGATCFRDDPALLSQILPVALSLGGIVVGARLKSLIVSILGIVLFLINATWFIDLLLRSMIEYRWSILMILGIGLVFGSSYVENGIKRIHRHYTVGK